MNRSSLILPRTQHKVGLLVVLISYVRRRFPITQFLSIKLWVGISFQIGDSLSALFPYLCVNFHKCVSVADFKVKFDQHFVQ